MQPMIVDVDTLKRIKNLLEANRSYSKTTKILREAKVLNPRGKPFEEFQIRNLDNKYWNLGGRPKKIRDRPVPTPEAQIASAPVTESEDEKILQLAAAILTNKTVPPVARIKVVMSLLS